uniref:Uncharacterized protein n=1 Tax=Lygus hesperus TaxID=30085 RepID=A0A146M5A1_LYGHE
MQPPFLTTGMVAAAPVRCDYGSPHVLCNSPALHTTITDCILPARHKNITNPSPALSTCHTIRNATPPMNVNNKQQIEVTSIVANNDYKEHDNNENNANSGGFVDASQLQVLKTVSSLPSTLSQPHVQCTQSAPTPSAQLFTAFMPSASTSHTVPVSKKMTKTNDAVKFSCDVYSPFHTYTNSNINEGSYGNG